MDDEIIETADASTPSPWSDYKPPDRKYLRVGGVFSFVYILGFAAYAVVELQAFLRMTPDEFAGFLSGVFAPLAFLWLVLGFMQQGEELRQSSHALWLQGEELRASVEQQRELVNVTREQLKFESEMVRQQREEIERNSQPRLNVITGGGHYSGHDEAVYEFFFSTMGRHARR